MKSTEKTISLNSVKIRPGNFVAITSLSLVDALYTIKELSGDEATKQNIQAVIDLVHSLRPTV